MLIIKVIGPGYSRCKDLEKMCFNVCAENDIDADIQKITDINQIASMGIIATPALFINDKLCIKGNLPTKSKLLNWIKENLKEHV